MRKALTLITLVALLAGPGAALAAPAQALADDGPAATEAAPAPALAVRRPRAQPWGPLAHQQFEVYAPAGARDAPLLLLVQPTRGGVAAKVARWVPRGVIVAVAHPQPVSRPGDEAQVDDLLQAVLSLRRQAPAWGGQRDKLVLLGAGDGARTVALALAAQPRNDGQDPLPWLGAVLLDDGRHHGLLRPLFARALPSRYPHVFALQADQMLGRATPELDEPASPLSALQGPVAPMLLVCSSRRGRDCPAAQRYAERAMSLGGPAQLLPQNLPAADLDRRLGEDNLYTAQVELFLRGLDPALDSLLAPP